MAQCNQDNCSLDVFQDRDECVLHCMKEDYQDDKRIGILPSFYEQILNYIVDNTCANSDDISANDLKSFLRIGTPPMHSQNLNVCIENIVFPQRDSRDLFDYKKILNSLNEIYFKFCKFNVSELFIENPKVFFDECIFHEGWYLFNHKLLGNTSGALYQLCTFDRDVRTIEEDYEKSEFVNPIFCNCTFLQKLFFTNVDIIAKVFNNAHGRKTSIGSIRILTCTLTQNFTLNNCDIGDILTINCKFVGVVEMQQCKIQRTEIINTNFSSFANFQGTFFEKFELHKSIFNDFVGFENCHFGNLAKKEDKSYLAIFKYTTFVSFVNFRQSTFICGLDIEHINPKDYINFLSAKILSNNSPRETYRIIKYSFDRVGNYIEGNKFYELEMKKYKEEVKKSGDKKEQFLLLIYEITSSYGQSYWRPASWLFGLSILFYYLTIGYKENYLYLVFPKVNHILIPIFNCLNSFAKSIIPFNKILVEGMEFSSILFYILFSSLFWLIILAIKRTTKR
jgi:uncharacterized protein YjbI with pentapeptide repeats